jgi:short-subunit dehydrogenase
VLVANAGLGQRGSIVDSAWDDLDVVLRTNIDGVLHSVRAAVPAMRRTVQQTGRGGNIIMISSVLSLATGPYCVIYSASKTTVNAIARGLRAELVPDNIWVTTMLVGQTHSEFAKNRRGQSGKVAGGLPNMPTDYVARCIVRESNRRRRAVTLRLVDRAINFAGLYAPWIMDRVLARVYKPKS